MEDFTYIPETESIPDTPRTYTTEEDQYVELRQDSAALQSICEDLDQVGDSLEEALHEDLIDRDLYDMLSDIISTARTHL